ncbi:uncharacterized protein LOC120121429 [Hibiscus syriacus]|uniref:uncharacterized protein LOC120121429 n=1 Tax=Hibiscus syriacus TaxID=106335 RepID=UPI001924BC9B|nr:uncharacterized protein LOC120121429 [Hibiscus syriacus]
MSLLNLAKNFIGMGNIGGRVRSRFIQEAHASDKVKDKAKEMAAKAKNSCDSAKEKAQKPKDSVADDSKEAIIKENAEKIKQSMNKKDW